MIRRLGSLLVAASCAVAQEPSPAAQKAQASHAVTTLRIGCSDMVLEPMAKLAEAYRKANPSVACTVSGGGSSAALAKMAEGRAEVAVTTRQATQKEIEAVRAKGFEPMELLFACEDIAIVVSKDNPIESLTLAQLADVFGTGGKTTAWSQLGVEVAQEAKGEIVPLTLSDNSVFADTFRKSLLGQRGALRPELTVVNGMKDVVDCVARSPGAIGYCTSPYVTDQVRAVPIVVKAGEPAVKPGDVSIAYPLRRSYYAYFRDEPTGSTKAFVTWFRKPDARAVLKEQGLFAPKP